MTECTAGKFCSTDGLPAVEGRGRFRLCTVSYYYLTLKSKDGNADILDLGNCLDRNCNPSALPNIICTGDCDEGYYCPTGSTKAKQDKCPKGAYCTAGIQVFQIVFSDRFFRSS